MDELLNEKIKEVKRELNATLSEMIEITNHSEDDCFGEAIKLFIYLPEQLKGLGDMLEREKNNYIKLEGGDEQTEPQEIIEGIEKIAEGYLVHNFQVGSMYILPDGKLLFMKNGHQAFFEQIKNFVADCTAPAYTLAKLGWIRLNTQVKYINLKGITPTPAQQTLITQAAAFIGPDVQIIE